MSKANNLTDFLTDLATTIRLKRGYPSTQKIDPQDFESEIMDIEGEPNLQQKTVSPSTSSQSVTPDSGYDGLSKVTVNAAPLQAKTVTPTASSQTVKPDTGQYGLSQVTVNGDSDFVAANIKNGVNIFGVTGTYKGTLQSKTVTPSTNAQTITPDTNYTGLSQVTVNAISPTKAAETFTPKTYNQTIAAGRWLTGTQTIKGDANLVASNIKSGVSIFGVSGTFSGSGVRDILLEEGDNIQLDRDTVYWIRSYAGGEINIDIEGNYFTIPNGYSIYIISLSKAAFLFYYEDRTGAVEDFFDFYGDVNGDILYNEGGYSTELIIRYVTNFPY